jgi:hypothetical protein
MRPLRFIKSLATGLGALALTGQALAAPAYSFRLYAPGICDCEGASAPAAPAKDPYC